MKPASLFQDKHVVVLGIARQGKALGRWLPQHGATVTLSDNRDFGALADDLMEFMGDSYVSYALGGHPVELLDRADMLCVSGGVPTNLPIIQEAYQRGIKVTNDILLFMEYNPTDKIIGITGSAGKTTTTTLVGEMCKKAGLQTWVGGNIGHVLLDDFDHIQEDDTVVMELSSFQLEIASHSPHIAAILNIAPNHLDRHGTLEAYAQAKANIFLHQDEDDIFVYGYDNPLCKTFAEIAPSRRLVAFSTSQLVADGASFAGRRLIVTGESAGGGTKVVCERDEIQLLGEHNVGNVAAACAIAGAAGVHPEAMSEVIRTFKGVPHRLEIVATLNDILWVNDSIATSPDRVVAALRSFNRPIILIAGGRDKNLDWSEMVQLAMERCKAVICFGEFGLQLEEHFQQILRHTPPFNPLPGIHTVKSLTSAVKLSTRLASHGDVVLLSPGGTSFDAYQDFAERGQHFRDLVQALQDKRR